MSRSEHDDIQQITETAIRSYSKRKAPLTMKYTTTALALAGLTTTLLALPSPSPSPLRILPPNWSFTITSLLGPGCPDLGKNGTVSRTTRPTFGSNTVDGSEIYYWFIAYPWLRVNLATGPRHTWCETTLAYTEYADVEKKERGEAYRLRLHKNGTRGIATYQLDEGVKAYWDFAYYIGEGSARQEVCDILFSIRFYFT